MQAHSCTLCSISTRHPLFNHENHPFCCPGCQAVFQILSSKNALADYKNHPLFKQAVQTGLISNPALLEQIQKKPEISSAEVEKFHLEIQEMWCPSCAEIITLVLLQEKGVLKCTIDYSTDLASIEYSPRYLSKEQIYTLIKSLGYRPAPLEDPNKKAISLDLSLRFIVAAFCALNIMMFSYPIYASYFDPEPLGYAQLFTWLSLAASLPVLGYSAIPIFRRFLTGLKVGLFGMETLVLLGVSTAFGLSLYEIFIGGHRVYFDSMSAIIAFVLLGKMIESKAKFSAKQTLLHLHRSLPKRGRQRLPDGSLRYISLKEAQIGDFFVAFSGEKIVLDGVVVEGEGTCDESLMTGEAWPVVKKKGALVITGSFVQQGPLIFQINKQFQDTTLSTILSILDQPILHKSHYVRSADLIVRWFIPLVVLIAFGTFTYTLFYQIADPNSTNVQTAVIRAISVLLISCPCAIGIAAPLAESHLMNALAKLGAIVRNRGCLTLLGKEDVIIFDKTGTITEGKFHVLDGLQRLQPHDQSILKGMASHSKHPISLAISQAISFDPLSFDQFDKIEEFSGKGLRAWRKGDLYFLGSGTFLQESGVLNVQKCLGHEDNLFSIVYFGKNRECLAWIMLGDRIHSDAPAVVQQLKEVETLLVSGDSSMTVAVVAKKCGFTHWHAQCNPFQKKEIVVQLRQKGKIVGMLGDGMNDALALAEVNIGISVMSATDISIQVSDILLTKEQLSIVPKIRLLARHGQKIIKQNLFWAFFYNVVGLGLAAGGLLSPIFAAFAMMASSLIVMFNARRIK